MCKTYKKSLICQDLYVTPSLKVLDETSQLWLALTAPLPCWTGEACNLLAAVAYDNVAFC